MAEAGPSTSGGAVSPISPPSSTGSIQVIVSGSRPKTSLVWDYFDFDPFLGKSGKSICQVLSSDSPMATGESDTASDICGASFEGKYPTNLRQHLKKSHPTQFAELVAKEEKQKKEKERRETARRGKSLKVSQQLTLAETLKSKSAYRKDSDRYQLISKKLAIFIGSSNVSNSIVDNLEFRDLLFALDGRYTMPGRAAMMKEIDKVVIELKAKISSYLQEASKVSICADIWSKKGMTSSYLGITGHFYSKKDCRRHSVTLAVRRMPSPHTGENIRDLVDKVLDEWEIPQSKVSATLTDNGSNMLAAFRPCESECDDGEDVDNSNGDDEDAAPPDVYSLVLDFEDREMDHELTFHSLKRVSCFAHTLQLVVQKFDEVATFKALLKRTHNLVSKVNKSTEATEKLIAICRKKLVRDCPTRWSSTYLMVDRLLLVKPALCKVLQELEWDDLAVSEWKTLEALRDLLQPFAKFTSLISGEDFTTISAVIPSIMDLNLHLEEVGCFNDVVFQTFTGL